MSDPPQPLILRPRSPRQHEGGDLHVNKPRVLHDLFRVLPIDKLLPCVSARGFEKFEILVEVAADIGAVVAAEVVLNLADFDVASGSDVIEHLTDEVAVVFDSILDCPAENID